MAEQDARLAWFGRADIWIAHVAAAVLAGMMVFVFAGAILRYVFNSPIMGANEILELSAVAVVMLGIPYCTARNAHVRIDLLDRPLGPRGRLATDTLYRLLGMIVLWFLTKSYVLRCLDALEYDDVTNMLDIVIWPFYALVAFGMGSYWLILTARLVLSIMGARGKP